jgi:hypothetical protein
VGIFDRFRQKSTRGVRSKPPHPRGREERTQEIRPDSNRSPHPSPPPINDPDLGHRPLPNRTVVRPIPDPAPQRPISPQPSRGDIDAPTLCINTGEIFKSVVVGVLVAVEGESEGEIYKLTDGENKIGRNPECEVQIPSRHISRPHAVLIHKNGTFAVSPLKSENPIYVNDERVEEVAQIGDRDFLKLGKTTLRLLSVA